MSEKQYLKLADQLRPEVTEVDVETVHQMLQNDEELVLVDVRELSEWVAGHIEQAIHLSKGVIEVKIEDAIEDKSKKLVLYCGGGYRSLLAAYNVKQIGYSNVMSMQGGIKAWRQQGYPIVPLK